MANTWYDEPAVMEAVNNVMNYSFLFVFTSEMGVKLLGLGSAQYFASGWNIFDFSLVTSWLAAELVKLALGGGMDASMLIFLR